jgi:hypothetical protein
MRRTGEPNQIKYGTSSAIDEEVGLNSATCQNKLYQNLRAKFLIYHNHMMLLMYVKFMQ